MWGLILVRNHEIHCTSHRRRGNQGMLKMRAILAIAFLIVYAAAYSQEPTPRPPIDIEKPQAETKHRKQHTEKDQRGTKQEPFIIEVIPAPRDEKDSAQKRKDHEEETTINRGIRDFTGLAALFTFLLVITSAIQVAMFWRQLKFMKKSTESAEGAAKAANTSAKALMLAERAYVKMSHVPPGIQWHKEDSRSFEIIVEVKNYGRTPTNVTDVVLSIKVLPNEESLPTVPSYTIKQREEIPGGFLMPGDWFTYTGNFGLFDKFDDVYINKSSKIWVIGYVDYIDVFQQRHRNGYARVYNRWLDGGEQNNLVLVTQAGYNYDRPRKKDEGND